MKRILILLTTLCLAICVYSNLSMQNNKVVEKEDENEVQRLIIYDTVIVSKVPQYLEYKEKFKNSTENEAIRVPYLSKGKRLKSCAGNVILHGDDPGEDVRKVFEYVSSVWESSILKGDSVFVSIKFAEIEEDINISTKTAIMQDTIIYPSALYNHINNIKIDDHTYPDGIITLNSNIDWDYGLDENIIPGKRNLAYGLMRAFAKILGFGSTCDVSDAGDYIFSKARRHNIFNFGVENSSGEKLSNIKISGGNASGALSDYINKPGETFWFTCNDKKYQLASPPYSKANPPFNYLYSSSSLMRYDLNTGDYNLKIDNETKEILECIGWIHNDEIISITSDDVPDTGITSAYTSHSFKVNIPSGAVNLPQWKLVLPLKNGNNDIIEIPDEGFRCIVPAIENEGNYLINSEGDIEASLQFKCNLNDKEISAHPFRMSLELKPMIDYAILTDSVVGDYNIFYDYKFKVKYRGIDRIRVTVEEQYSPVLQPITIKEPYIAYGELKHINRGYWSWIDFEVLNEYGKSVYTITLPPNGNYKPVKAKIDEDNLDEYNYLEIRNIHGIRIKECKKTEEDEIQALDKGIYIFLYKRDNQIIKKEKVIVS